MTRPVRVGTREVTYTGSLLLVVQPHSWQEFMNGNPTPNPVLHRANPCGLVHDIKQFLRAIRSIATSIVALYDDS